MKVIIIGVTARGNPQKVIVREVVDEATALRRHPYIKKYDRWEYDGKIRFDSPAAQQFYKKRKAADPIKNIIRK